MKGVYCIFTDVLTILLFHTKRRKGLSVLRRRFRCCWFVVVCCSHSGVLRLFNVLLYMAMCPF